MDETWGSWVGVRKDTKTHSQLWCFKSSSCSNGGRQWSVAYPQWLVLIKNNNYPLSKDDSVLIFVGMAAVLLTLSSIDRPYKYENFNFSVLRQGFKNYSHDQNILFSILSPAHQILSRTTKLAISKIASDAACQAITITSLSSKPAYWTPLFGQYFTMWK